MNSAPGFQGARDDRHRRGNCGRPGYMERPDDYIPTVVMGTGMGGLWILAYLKDWIVSAKTHESKCKEVDARTAERDAWQERYLDEVAAHQRTREAAMTSTQQASIAADPARVAVSRHRGTAPACGAP